MQSFLKFKTTWKNYAIQKNNKKNKKKKLKIVKGSLNQEKKTDSSKYVAI